MRIIEQLVYKIQGDNTEFDKSIDKSETKVNKFGSVADKMLAGITVAAITMVVKKVGDMVVATAQATDRVDKMSQKIGISRTAFQEWDFILSQSGASVEGLQMGVKTLSNAADEARKGTALYADAFNRLGVSATDVNGDMKDQETLFNEVFVALSNLDNQTERTAIANKLLGRSATELAPAFNAGGDAIEDMRSKAHQLGLVMGDDLIDQGVVLTDNIDKLKRAYQGWKNEALEPLLGLAVTFTDKMLGQNKGTVELEKQTRNLTTQSVNYKNIISQLKDPMSVLTEAEKARLGILKQIQAQNLEDTIYQTSRAYKESANAVNKAKRNLEELEIKQSAYTLVTNDFASAQLRLKELTQTKNRTTQEELELSNLRIAMMDTEFQRQTEILSLTDRIDEQRTTAESLNSSYATSLRSISEAVADNVVNVNQYALTNVDFYNAVMDNVTAINKEREAVKFAQEEYDRYANSTLTEVTARINEFNQASELSLAGQYALQKLLQRKQEIEAKSAMATEDLAKKEEARNAIIKDGTDAMESAEQYALALGSSYDLNAQKASILETTIKSLIDSGLTAEDKAVADLIPQLQALKTTTEEVTNTSVESFNAESKARSDAYAEIEKSRMSDKDKAFKAIQDQADAYLEAGVSIADVAKWQSEQIQKYQDEQTRKAQEEADKQKAIEEEKTRAEQEELEKRNQAILEAFNQNTKTRADAYKLLESYSLSERDKAMANIQAQADKFLEAGVSIVDVATWQKNELAKLQEEQADKAEEEAERVRKAWEDATFSMLGSVTSIWGSINQVQANQNEEEIQRIKDQNAIAIQAAKDRGASEEEITELEKSLQADLNDAKNKYAQEEADRNKALSTLSVILDTAKAIMQIWSNPLISPWGKGLWTGLAAGAGAAQIAAINSAPVPSYDVGSIRIPETTTATVHKDEMILTAPQAEQARREGITIAPTKNGGNSVNLMIYLDGKEIARNTIDNLNSGSVGTIKARVVK